ncbi:MAG: hypothetical protein LBU35_00775 [Holosporales bacterium]|jgi:chromosomal replication initiation ATPase DnaA|nr:hypothetical protein [Holosporales bacterium]
MSFRQLTLPISWAFSYKNSDFVVSDCNRYAFEWLEKWPFKIQDCFVCLVGESGSGKTLLSKIWASRMGAEFIHAKEDIFAKWYEISSNTSSQKYFVIDNADEITDSILLFYIYNTIKEKNAYLLLTANTPPTKWDLKLNDIRSRMSTINVIRIQPPNELAMLLIIEKMLLQRGIKVSKEIIRYISNRIERSYDSINYWINQIDKRLDKHTKATLSNIKKIIS